MPPNPEVRRRTLLGRGARLALAALVAGPAVPVAAQAQQGVELTSLRTSRDDGVLSLDFTARVALPRAVEEALSRGVPVYFVAQATLWRSRWYWRDERVARVTRQWRIAFQPLTGHWRVGLGGLNQTHATLDEALASASRGAGWKLADLSQIDPDQSYTVEFEYRLDLSQLPSPMQFGLVTQGDWAFGVTRVLKLQQGLP
ncbi:MAG: DUF4390 domain-containing protein [Rubrivivax sp.]|nr:DUF4390 domain-containing protein [Rubrivivax sp.]